MFSTEKELVDILKETMSCDVKVSQIFSVPKLENVVLTEVDLGYGRADLVVAGYQHVTPCATSEKLDHLSMLTLFYLEEKKIASYYEIFSSMCIRKERLNFVIDKLESAGYVKHDSDHLCLIKKYSNQIEFSCAIEAKLKNWKRALHQAYRYKWFSDHAFVCLPYSNLTPAIKNIDYFKELGVGLMAIDQGGGVDVAYAPEKTSPVSVVMNSLLNELALGQSGVCT